MTTTVHALALGVFVALPIAAGHVLYLARPVRVRTPRDPSDH